MAQCVGTMGRQLWATKKERRLNNEWCWLFLYIVSHCKNDAIFSKFFPILSSWLKIRGVTFCRNIFFLNFETQEFKIWRGFGNQAKRRFYVWLAQKCTCSQRGYGVCCLVNAWVMNQTCPGINKIINKMSLWVWQMMDESHVPILFRN